MNDSAALRRAVGDAIRASREEALAARDRQVGAGAHSDAVLVNERIDAFLRDLRRQGYIIHADVGECFAAERVA